MGKGDPWALLGGNSLVRDGALLDRLNPADRRLLEPAGLLERVDGMAGGDPEAELPSCNLVLRPRLGLRYPPAASAEDHWFVARLLLAAPERVRLAEDLLLTRYSLSGSATAGNHGFRPPRPLPAGAEGISDRQSYNPRWAVERPKRATGRNVRGAQAG